MCMASAAAVAVEQSKVRKAERRNILTIWYFAFFSVNKKAKLWKTGGGVDGTPTIAFCHVSEFFSLSFPSSSLSL